MTHAIYLDFNATTPVAAPVADAMLPYLRGEFGNPSSDHVFGHRARAAVARARSQVAALLGCAPEEVIFTSGGTESNNHALRGYAFAHRDRGRHLVTSRIEHPAVLEVCAWLETQGFEVTYLPVDPSGRIRLADLEAALRDDTLLVTIMLANNEVGALQPIREIGAILRDRGIALHTDAAQAVGKIPVDVDDLGVDLLSVAGHKLYAPKGVGALYVRSGVELDRLLFGAAHESGRRAGTENLLEIVGLGAACELAARGLEEFHGRMAASRDRLEAGLRARLPWMQVNGHPSERLPNTLSVSFPGVEAGTILAEAAGVAASAGAACHADSAEISHVLRAMGLPDEAAIGTIRLSTGRETTDDEVDRAIDEIARVVERLAGPGAAAEAGPSGRERAEIRLTRFTHGLGCACKLRPQLLEKVLRKMPRPEHPDVLVGVETSDDAAVYRIDPATAIVQTVDFFTPVVDDPYRFGQIAAANSLSDVYAMGARPLFALDVVGFPSNRLPAWVLEEILRGAIDKAAEAGIVILGGHTVDDVEPKFGLAVTGVVHPDRIWRNRGARPGDVLVLTKPIGTGILSTALKQGTADAASAERLFETMATLNRAAADVLAEFTVHACTDVTGFGLVGHLHEMTSASGVDAEIEAAEVPLLAGARDLALGGAIPGGTLANLEHAEGKVAWGPVADRATRILLCDAQTSGGLLAAIAGSEGPRALARLREAGVRQAAIVGRIVREGSGSIRVG